MADVPINSGRRRFLTGSAVAVGAVGAGFATVPFLSSFEPSARAEAAGAPVDVNIGKLAEGQMVTVAWRGQPIYVVHRTDKMIEALPSLDSQLLDPDSAVATQQPKFADNFYRSRKKNIFVVVGICTHLGCAPTYRPEVAPKDLGPDWKGGFFCPCHGSKYDLAGRVYKSMPAPLNLLVPDYIFATDDIVRIGVAEKKA
ncbi:ubiquinol-cytochrome c reductase iron-sulfur subunit [Halothiobacillus sp.]|jgi:ubiquinol-cytochrome c reductase iron-sulfur subunit|uniref:ubiquinol-cytochrome c reductase iron-sulfur subunit n=1 Tax=Halothiobacillus sp. TaxID=1891311 RepID=UPI000BD739F5|nr:ubiquinol-cytochrome c reductase iron-sulfur subunit [Halothiobacillus sp.]OZB73421.1 MAG: ubiquinol-cytochrome c reductase iron-sulfur subunit [Halothiobacillus sp. 14-55-98]OZB81565.1 MAG: ubiquinol-cytochrome c reductase iron-sulfur subunit [Halothiobacillus sp. 13-55-253]MDD3576863.1 ubiquinol-cytochrome c reductase iron-sulfur subunit [Halothiobacillus sp.]MDD4966819.1 ubiquinol-cytochrome c reductase iron-sulfur subunit [Halothiobacillus sp.]MDY0148112.1 ubiquinol-cytochrome c reducta